MIRRIFGGGLRAAGLVLAIAPACLIAARHAGAQTAGSSAAISISEEKVKAAFVGRFLHYVEWPASSFPQPDTPYVIGIVGAADVAQELEKSIATQGAGKRPVVVRRLGDRDPVQGMHALYVGGAGRSQLTRWIGLASREPILLITEVDGVLPHGSMINFHLADDRVRFDVALEPVEKAGLKLNSRLLSVAMTVIKSPAP